MLCPFNCALTVRSPGLPCELSLTTFLLLWIGDDWLWDWELTGTGEKELGMTLVWCSSNEGYCFEAFSLVGNPITCCGRGELSRPFIVNLEGSGNKDCFTTLGISSKCLAGNEGSLPLLWTLRVVDSVGERGNRGVVQCGTTTREDWASLGWVLGGPVVLGPLGQGVFEFRVLKWTSRTETFDFFCLTRVVGEVLISYANFRSFETFFWKTWPYQYRFPCIYTFWMEFPDVTILKGETCLIGDQIKHVSWAKVCFHTTWMRSYSLSRNKKINWKPSSGRSQENEVL